MHEEANLTINQHFSLILLFMDPNPHHLRFQIYALFVGVNGLMVQTIAQATESTRENKIRMGIALGTLAMNVLIARWVFSQTGDVQENKWKAFIFNLTGIIPPYLAYSMLIPEWFTWLGFPIICIILTVVETYNLLQTKLIWSYEKCVNAMNYLRKKFSDLTFR